MDWTTVKGDKKSRNDSAQENKQPQLLQLDFIRAPNGSEFLAVELLGRGKYGEVHRCAWLNESSEGQSRFVAIKVQELCHLREVEIMQTLRDCGGSQCADGDEESKDNKNIIKMLHHFQLMNTHLMVLELMPTDLWKIIQKQPRQRLTFGQTSTVAWQLLIALDWLKVQGIIHADIKLHNVLVDPCGSKWKTKLADFGLSFYKKDAANFKGALIQSVPNRAPEVYLGATVTEAIDIWSLGCLCATMIFGVQWKMFMPPDPLIIMHLRIRLFGNIPRRVLNDGLYTCSFFTLTADRRYKLKKGSGVAKAAHEIQDKCGIHSCFDIRNQSLSTFLSRCLHMDPSGRIVPQEALLMDFVRK